MSTDGHICHGHALRLMLVCLVPGATWAQTGGEPAAPGAAALVLAHSPYGLPALWASSDAVTKSVLLVLLLMSVGSWCILLFKWWDLRSMRAHSRAARGGFWQCDTVAQGLAGLDARSPFRSIADAAVQAAQPQSGLLARVAQQEWVDIRMRGAVEAVQQELHSGLAFLATVGSVSPFVGLFGTVWGIFHALTAIGASGQASIDKVAGPVGEALIMTALGLAVAVPAVLAYNWALSRNKLAMAELRAFANELHAVFSAPPGQS